MSVRRTVGRSVSMLCFFSPITLQQTKKIFIYVYGLVLRCVRISIKGLVRRSVGWFVMRDPEVTKESANLPVCLSIYLLLKTLEDALLTAQSCSLALIKDEDRAHRTARSLRRKKKRIKIGNHRRGSHGEDVAHN